MVKSKSETLFFTIVLVLLDNVVVILFEYSKSISIFLFGSIGSSVFNNEFLEFNFVLINS